MNNYINTLLGLLLCLALNSICAQQTEIEYDSGAGDPHLLLTEDGPGNSFSRLTMENQQPGNWTIAARSGASTDFNVFFQDDVNPGLNYLNIDPNNNLTRFRTDLEIEDNDLVLTGNDPWLTMRSDGTGDAIVELGASGFNTSRVWYDNSQNTLKLGVPFAYDAFNINNSSKAGFNISQFSSTEALRSAVTISAFSGSGATPAHLELFAVNNGVQPNIIFTNQNRAAFWEIRGGSELSSLADGFMRFIHSDDGVNEDVAFIINGSDGLIGVNDELPEYTVSIDHGSGAPSAGGDHGLNIENTANDDSWTFYTRTSSGDLQFFYDFNTTDAIDPILRGTIDSGNGAYTSNSDRRLKKNISTLTGQLDKVMQMRPTKYQFKNQDSDEYSLGLIAQELQEIIPEVVGEISNEEEHGADYLGVSYTELIPVLIVAIQEQQEIINSQSNYIKQMDNEMDAMSVSLQSKVNELVKSALAAQLKDDSTTAQHNVKK